MSTVIYDGECRFCIERVNALKQLRNADSIEWIARQHESTEQRFPEIIGVDLEEGMVYIDAQRKLHFGAEAFYEISKSLKDWKLSLYKMLYPLPILKQCFHVGYRIIAANRKRLGRTCDNNVCKLPQ